MKLPFKSYVILVLLNIILFIAPELSAQFNYETGFYPRVHFSPKDYNNASPQNWDIVQDSRGIMFFANNEGVLEYDGIEWRLEKVDNESPVKSLEIASDGRIYVGAVGEFGYLAPNNLGDLKYHSLSKLLNDTSKQFAEVWYTHSIGNNVYFLAQKYLFKWDGEKISIFKPKQAFHTSFRIDDLIILNEPSVGLFMLKDDKIKRIEGDQFPPNSTLFSFQPYKNDQYLVAAGMDGFYEVSFKKKTDVWSLDINEHISNNSVNKYFLYNVAKAGENTFSIGTWSNGLLLLRQDKLKQRVTKESGLTDENVLSQFYDKDGNLWVALSKGITKVEISSPITHFSQETGVEGVVEGITRWNGLIHIATDRGVKYLPDYQLQNNKIYIQNKFKSFAEIQGGAFDILNYKTEKSNDLLVVVSDGVIAYNAQKQKSYVLKSDAYTLYQSKTNPHWLYVGNGNGLTLIQKKKNQWQIINKFEEVNTHVFSFAEDKSGNLYAGTVRSGVMKFQFNNSANSSEYKMIHIDSAHGMPKNSPARLCYFDNKVLVGTDQGLYQVIKESNQLERIASFPSELSQTNRLIHQMQTDGKRLWITSFVDLIHLEIGYIHQINGKFEWVPTPFRTISEGIIHKYFPDKNNVIWMGGTEGLFRYDAKVKKNYKKDFAALIRLNIIGNDSTIFFGSYFDEKGRISTIQPDVLKPNLPYKYNNLEFRFAAQNTGIMHPLQFSFKLEGYDKEWSEWSTETKRYYTNLNEGEYNFRVKVKNIYDHQSHEASYEFSIEPPWYRTTWAYIGYFLLLILIVYLIVNRYTKYLREIIRQKTAEIRNQKEIVEKKNQEITDSIRYAKRIQEAMLPPRKILDDAGTDYFILFKPRDIVSGDFYWFRQIGDYQVIVAADSTGHGVPGAFVSMLGMAFLNEIAAKITDVSANEILNQLRAYVIKSLRQGEEDSDSKDGMDLALYVVDKQNKKVQFAGANNPLVIIRDGEIIQIKGDRMPIGMHLVMDDFKNNEIDVQKGDMLYTFSDGYQDQFGGEKGSKFMIKRMKKLMAEVATKPVYEQREIFDTTIEEWMAKESQIDDIILIGVRI